MASTTPNSPLDTSIGALSKMKVADLKKELKARGLNSVGTKTELVERLQGAMTQSAQDVLSEDGNVEAEIPDEDDILGGEEEGGDFDDEDELAVEAVLAEEVKPKPMVVAPHKTIIKRPAALAAESSQDVQPKKRVLIRPPSVSSTGKENGSQDKKEIKVEEKIDSVENGNKILKLSGVSVKERLELRAKKFGVPLPASAQKEARAERFGMSTTNTKISMSPVPNADLLKKRAERFGVTVSNVALKVELSEKLKKRQERFGTVSTDISSLSVAERKKLRAERFNK